MKTKALLIFSIFLACFTFKANSQFNFNSIAPLNSSVQTDNTVRGVGIGFWPASTATNARLHVSNFYCNNPGLATLNGFLFRTDGRRNVDNMWQIFTGNNAGSSTEKFRLFVPALSDNTTLQTTQANGRLILRNTTVSFGSTQTMMIGQNATNGWPRVGIGNNVLQNPAAHLHIGEELSSTGQGGYRPWMDIGMLINVGNHYHTTSGGFLDNMFVGLRPIVDPFNPGFEKTEAIITWGNNPVIPTDPNQFNHSDRLRFVFTSSANTAPLTSADPEGLEISRMIANGMFGRVGIGGDPVTPHLYSNGIDPGNTLEVNSSDPNATATVGGGSGLRFTDLTTSSIPLTTNPGLGVLAVDADGDVVYVPDGGNVDANSGCRIDPFMPGRVQLGFNPLLQNTPIILFHKNLYFTGSSGSNSNKVAIGESFGNPLPATLNVLHSTAGFSTLIPNASVALKSEINGSNYLMTNYVSGLFLAQGALNTNIAGYYSAPGATNFGFGHHAIVVPKEASNVCIGLNPLSQGDNYLLAVGGPTASQAALWSVISDSTSKKNILSYSDGLPLLRNLHPIEYELNANYGLDNGLKHWGLIAQDVASVVPYAVDTTWVDNDSIGSIKTPLLMLNPNPIFYMMVNSIKELDSIVQNDSIFAINGINKQDHDIKLGGPLTEDTEIGLMKSLLLTSDNSNTGLVCVGSAFTPQNEAFVVNNKTWTTSAKFFNFKAGSTDNVVARFETSGSSNNNYAGQFVAKGNDLISNYGATFEATGKTKTNYGIYSEASGAGINYAGFFNGPLYASSYLNLPSDSRIKSNIQPFSNSLDLIDQLKPKTFYFDTVNFVMLNLPKGKQYGLIAQDVEPFLPNSVKTIVQPAKYDSLGNVIQDSVHFKSLNYETFIPVLIQGMKDLKQLNTSKDSLILSMYERLNALETIVSTCCQNTQTKTVVDPSFSQNVELNNAKAIVLNQNMPNPFSENTVITFQIPETVNNAQIMFADNNGSIIKTIDISERGFGELKVYAANLSSGSYVYYLVCDGKTIDTKRMVCTK